MAREYGPTAPGAANDGTLVGLVRGWANRDLQALPDEIIMDSLRYAIDKAYRTLRIPPLEHTALWTNYPGMYILADGTEIDIADAAALATARETNPGGTYSGPLTNATAGGDNVYQSVTSLEVPPDLIEFIHIRGTDDNGLTTRVFNEKSDIRSYWDIRNNHYEQSAFWSRQGDSVVLTPSFANVARGFYGGGAGSETTLEMYYYRRLPALNARFDVTAHNANLYPFAPPDTGGVSSNGLIRFPRDEETGQPLWLDTNTGIYYNTEVEIANPDDRFEEFFVGEFIPNWFRDENEKIALYGALAECFAYLQEDDQAGKYTQLMMKEIEELNEEDRMRDASGGNIQTQYTANGLI